MTTSKVSDPIQLGQKIRVSRKAMKLTMEELAARTQSSKGYISNLELGSIHAPSVYKVEKFADALETTLDYLLYEDVDMPTATDRKFFREYLGMESRIKRKIRATVKLWTEPKQ